MRIGRSREHPWLAGLALALALIGLPVEAGDLGASAVEAEVRRTNNRSPQFFISEADVGFFMNYTGYAYSNRAHGEGERFLKAEIGSRALEMIAAAEKTIIMSIFLFDSFYAPQEGQRDLVTPVVDALLERRRNVPDIRIAVILDPSHKAYGQRQSPAEKIFRGNGIDVFYSDLVSGLKKASPVGFRETMGHANRLLDTISFHGWGYFWSGLFSRARIPTRFDGEPVSIESAYNAFLMKANHRKLLVTDVHGQEYVAMITSANPHSASGYHVNSAVTVKGDAARYVHNLLRLDMMHSAGLGRLYAHWHYDATRRYRKTYFSKRITPLPLDLPVSADRGPDRAVGVTVVTESRIPEAIIERLHAVRPGDEIRIQMFYLSFQPVLDAVLHATTITENPVRILLDANKDSFNKVKDGTPNRQVARYLLREARKAGGNLEVRWYSTHGEQNHAKTMSITNARTGAYFLTTGSCNWTGRNMDGVNMESNIIVDGAPRVNRAFDDLFDLFWTNRDGNEYSLDYEVYQDAASDVRWRRGEKPYYLSTF